jgi:hypothetical protein
MYLLDPILCLYAGSTVDLQQSFSSDGPCLFPVLGKMSSVGVQQQIKTSNHAALIQVYRFVYFMWQDFESDTLEKPSAERDCGKGSSIRILRCYARLVSKLQDRMEDCAGAWDWIGNTVVPSRPQNGS